MDKQSVCGFANLRGAVKISDVLAKKGTLENRGLK